MPLQLLVAVLAGASMPLAFAPFSLWPVAVLSPALLIYQVLRLESSRDVFWLGWVYAVAYLGTGLYWVYYSLHVYGHAPLVLAVGLTVLLVCYLALYVGGVMLLYRRLVQRFRAGWVYWTLPLLWFAMEWFKGWVITGFPWLSLGYAHIDSPYSGFAPILGVFGLSALSVFASLALVRLFEQKQLWPLLLAAGLGVAGLLLHQIEWTRSYAEPIRVSMIQGNIAQEMKWRRSERGKILERYWQMTGQHWDSDLIVWPEAAIPGRSEDMQKDYLEPMARTAAANNSHLLTGILVSNWLKREYHNSMILLGEQQGAYHKRHLVPFGEFMPLRGLLEFMRDYIKIPMSDMKPGADEQELIEVNGLKLGVSICYEDVFSRDINLDLPAANLLINTSNDAWFGDSLAPHQHLEIARMRALETGRSMVRSTNTGRSAFIDHRGGIISATEQFKAEALSEQMQGRSGATPFIGFARIQPYLSALILLLAFYFLRRGRTH